MNYPCTYFDIYRWNTEIVKLQSQPVPLRDLLNDIPQKLTAFKQDNQLKFEMVMGATETMNKKYFQILTDENGKESLNLDAEGNPIFIDPSKKEEFEQELDAFFKTKSSVVK